MGTFFSPSEPAFMISVSVLGVLLLIIVIVIITIVIRKHHHTEPGIAQKPVQMQAKQAVQMPVKQQFSSEEKQLVAYVKRNLARGYQKEDLKKVLLNAGWNSKVIEKVFMKV